MPSDKATEEILRVVAMSPQEQDRYFASLPPDKTSTVLVDDLLKKPQSAIRDELIDRAKRFVYDDFKSMLPDLCPKMALHHDLQMVGYNDLAKNVRDGKYD